MGKVDADADGEIARLILQKDQEEEKVSKKLVGLKRPSEF